MNRAGGWGGKKKACPRLKITCADDTLCTFVQYCNNKALVHKQLHQQRHAPTWHCNPDNQAAKKHRVQLLSISPATGCGCRAWDCLQTAQLAQAWLFDAIALTRCEDVPGIAAPRHGSSWLHCTALQLHEHRAVGWLTQHLECRGCDVVDAQARLRKLLCLAGVLNEPVWQCHGPEL